MITPESIHQRFQAAFPGSENWRCGDAYGIGFCDLWLGFKKAFEIGSSWKGARISTGCEAGHCLNKAADALEALEGQPQWRPIESAPRDGTHIILTNGATVAQGWWEHEEPYVREKRDVAGVYVDQQEHDGFDDWLDCGGGMIPNPTHWMPLPAPPVQQAAAAPRKQIEGDPNPPAFTQSYDPIDAAQVATCGPDSVLATGSAQAAAGEAVDEFTNGVNAAAAMLDKKADDFATDYSRQDPDTGTWEFRSEAKEDYYNTLRELAGEVRDLVHGNACTSPHAAVNAQLLEALKLARNGLAWYQDAYPTGVSEADHEAMAEIDAAIAATEKGGA